MNAIAKENKICTLTPVGNREICESFNTNRNSNAEMMTVTQKSKVRFPRAAFGRFVVRWKMDKLVSIAPKTRAEFRKYFSADPPSKTNLASPAKAPVPRNT